VPLLPAGHALPEAQRERWHERLADPGGSMLVAEQREQAGGALLGFVGCGESRDPDAAAGTGELQTVWSFAANDGANAFYEAHGFRPDGAERREEAWAGILEIRYRRTLA
jgi:hypothetical protein